MSDRTKRTRNLGVASAVAVAGLAPITALVAAGPASALSSASLSLSSQAVAATGVTVTDSFTVGQTVPAGGTITVATTSTGGSNAPSAAVQLPTALADYTVTASGVGTESLAGTPTATSATLTVSASIPAGSVVTVTATGASNPTAASTVYLSDSTSVETTVINTNTVSVGVPSNTPPAVNSVNPTAFTSASGEPFTVTGTNFAIAATDPPVVCFVQTGTAIPAAGTGTDPCTGTGTAQATLDAGTASQSSTQLQAVSPALTGAKTYQVVVYNYNDTTGVYTLASTPTSTTVVGVQTGLDFIPESGIRAVDSRLGAGLPRGTLTPGAIYAIPLATFENTAAVPTNVPGTATALSLNVTAVGPAGPGNLQVWSAAACSTPPATSTVNFQPGQDTSNSTFVATNGFVCVEDNGASVQAVMDVTGYTLTGGVTFPATPTRVLDTRTGTGGLAGPLAGGTIYRFDAAKYGFSAGEPVALDVTAVDPTAPGNLRVFPEPVTASLTGPTQSDVPTTAVLTYIPGVDAASLDVTQVGQDGYIDIYSAGTGTVNVVFDEVATLTGSSLIPVATPYRVLDTRQTGGLAAGGTVTATGSPSGSGADFVPSGALGVVGSIADINPAGPGNLRTFPQGGVLPGTSTINDYPGQTRSTTAVVAVNPGNGQFSVESSGSATNATFDVSGYITAPPATPPLP